MTDAPKPAGRILIVDDEATAVENLAHVCRKQGHEVTTRTSGAGAIEALERNRFDVVLTDLQMGKVDGMAVLRRARELDPETAVVLITGFATLDSAVAAMKAGAFHYVAKPFRLDEVREVVRNALELVRLKRENRALREQLTDSRNGPTIITQDAIMTRLLEMARQIGPADTNVLISGESGTGKELLARYIHAHSGRAGNRFQAVNCGALQEDLLANELFGHEKGAYTGAIEAREGLIEAANGGTLFLDEIAEMSLGMQVKLLRVLQEREITRVGGEETIRVDVRLIAATNKDLPSEVDAGRFREDLYYRLNVVTLNVPALKERQEDIPLLARHYLSVFAEKNQKHMKNFTPQAMDRLLRYDWPGNVRELMNVVERAVVLSTSDYVEERNLPPALREPHAEEAAPAAPPVPADAPLEEVEKAAVLRTLAASGGNKSEAARRLGITRRTLHKKLKKYGLMEDRA